MLTCPMQVNESEYIIIVALEDENLDRIKEHDPAQIQFDKLAHHFPNLKLKDIHLTYISPEEMQEAKMMVNNNQDARKLMLKICSGWKYRPDQGDNDLPPFSLYPKN